MFKKMFKTDYCPICGKMIKWYQKSGKLVDGKYTCYNCGFKVVKKELKETAKEEYNKQFGNNQKLEKSNDLVEKMLKYKTYNPYLKNCPDKQVQIACKDCNCLRDVYEQCLNYIEENENPKTLLLLIYINDGLGVLYNERTIFYINKYLKNPISFQNDEEKYFHYLEIYNILANCYKKDYLITNELETRKLCLEYANLYWKEYIKHETIPNMEYYGNRETRKRITELNDDLKIIKKVEKQTNKNIDLTKPVTNRKVLKRIDVYSDNIYNLKTGEIIE